MCAHLDDTYGIARGGGAVIRIDATRSLTEHNQQFILEDRGNTAEVKSVSLQAPPACRQQRRDCICLVFCQTFYEMLMGHLLAAGVDNRFQLLEIR